MNFALQPAVANDLHEVLWVHGLENRHRKLKDKRLFALNEASVENEELRIEDHLPVDASDDYPERLRVSMNALVPFEISLDGEFNLKTGSRDRLEVCIKLKPWELMDLSMQCLPQFRVVDQLADLGWRHVIEVIPGKLLLLLNPPEDLLWDSMELSQGRHALPLTLVNHLADAERLDCDFRPAALEENLEETTHNPARGLGYIGHVRVQRETFQSAF